MMEPAKDRVCNNVSEPLDRACAGRVLPEAKHVSRYLVIVNGIFRKDPAKVFRVEHDQMIGALAPGRPDQALRAYPFCQGERNDVGRSRFPLLVPEP